MVVGSGGSGCYLGMVCGGWSHGDLQSLDFWVSLGGEYGVCGRRDLVETRPVTSAPVVTCV